MCLKSGVTELGVCVKLTGSTHFNALLMDISNNSSLFSQKKNENPLWHVKNDLSTSFRAGLSYTAWRSAALGFIPGSVTDIIWMALGK